MIFFFVSFCLFVVLRCFFDSLYFFFFCSCSHSCSSGNGGDSSAVAGALTGVRVICGAGQAFAALRTDGTVVSWGDKGLFLWLFDSFPSSAVV